MAREFIDELYPEHDRTSCSDAVPCNADAAGSHGCARCTALAFERGERAERLLKLAMQTLEQIATTPRNAGAKRNANATLRFIQTQMQPTKSKETDND